MFTLDYAISNKSKDTRLEEQYDLKALTASELYFSDLFIGDTIIKNDEVDLSARWGWVPIFHLAELFVQAAIDLKTQTDAEYEFTEYPHKIFFHKQGTKVAITASYATGTIELDLDGFTKSTRSLLIKALDDAETLHPDISDSPVFKDLKASLLLS